MALIAKEGGNGGTKFSNPDPGAYIARCVRIVDLGTHEDPNYQNKDGSNKTKHLVQLGWELLGTKRPEGDGPFAVFQRYTVSLGEKANLRKALESWRGRPFTAAELEGFDLKNVLNKPCMLNVIHETKGDKTYCNVASLMPLPQGVTAPAAETEQLFFSISDWDEAAFTKLSERTQETIKSSIEFKEADGTAEAEAPTGGVANMDDDIPF